MIFQLEEAEPGKNCLNEVEYDLGSEFKTTPSTGGKDQSTFLI